MYTAQVKKLTNGTHVKNVENLFKDKVTLKYHLEYHWMEENPNVSSAEAKFMCPGVWKRISNPRHVSTS